MSATDFGSADHVIHIPGRDLRGTRDEKLAALDLLLAQLQVVRLALCGHVVQLGGAADAGGQPPRAPAAVAAADEDL